MKKLWIKIKCLFGEHDLEIVGSEPVKSILTGETVRGNIWGCKHCEHIDSGVTVTETLF